MKKLEFAKLQRHWYELAGFELERSDTVVETEMRPHSAGRGRERDAQEIATLAEYYRRAGHFLHEHEFAHPVERRMWELHGDGASYTRIARTIRREIQAGSLPRRWHTRAHVQEVIPQLRALMLGLGRRKAGRPRNPGGLRADGVALHVRLSRDATLALDQLRVVLQVSGQECIRRILIETANNMASRNRVCGR